MLRRHTISSPRDGLIVVQVFGDRDERQAEATQEAFLAAQQANPGSQVLFDVRQAEYNGPAELLYARAIRSGQGMARCKVAILAQSLDSVFARFWRRGLIETGHETAVFVCAQEADAWLASRAEADTLFLA
ncbi:MAG: hypothetical protein JJU18_09165 [Oceanicaulis sp.]|nr:hypothetical protein [Oceanicaulis sp.]